MSYVGEAARFMQDSGTAAGSKTIAFGKSVAVGHTLILCVDAPGGTAGLTFSVTDTKGNTWTQREVEDSSVNNFRFAVLATKVTNALTTSDTFTVGLPSGTRATWLVLVQEFDDIISFDQGNVAFATGSTAIDTGASGTPAQNAQVVFCCFAWSGTDTLTAPTGFTAPASGGLNATTAARQMACFWEYIESPAVREVTTSLTGSSTAWGSILTLHNSKKVPTCYIFNGTTDVPVDLLIA